jgi:hypothetical protein
MKAFAIAALIALLGLGLLYLESVYLWSESGWIVTMVGVIGMGIALVRAIARAARLPWWLRAPLAVAVAGLASCTSLVACFILFGIQCHIGDRQVRERFAAYLESYPLPPGARLVAITRAGDSGGAQICYTGAALEIETGASEDDLEAHYNPIREDFLDAYEEGRISIEKTGPNSAVVQILTRAPHDASGW